MGVHGHKSYPEPKTHMMTSAMFYQRGGCTQDYGLMWYEYSMRCYKLVTSLGSPEVVESFW